MSSEDIDIVTQLSDAQAKCDLSPCDCLCFLHEDAIWEIVLLRKQNDLLRAELRAVRGE